LRQFRVVPRESKLLVPYFLWDEGLFYILR
jgi:hypothetical protein